MLAHLQRCKDSIPSFQKYGWVTDYIGLIVEAVCPAAFIGELCEIYPTHGKSKVLAEVVGFKGERTLLMPYEKVLGIGKGNRVHALGRLARIGVGQDMLGRILDGFARPIDDQGDFVVERQWHSYQEPINPMQRKSIDQAICSGIRAIDGLMTLGYGQRVGLMAGSGVGKSSLIASLTRHMSTDVKVVALIGERGREVEEFVNQVLGKDGLANTIIIAATAESSPLMRVHAARNALAVAEYFASTGKSVLLAMDSITRYAIALREIGLAVGEPPTVKGYTPSVFSAIPQLVERCGNFCDGGSITGIFSVLVESDDFNDPVVDAARAILDGHIVLTRELAEVGHFPAIDIAKSVSRLANQLVDPEQLKSAKQMRQFFAEYQRNKEFIELEIGKESDSRRYQDIRDSWSHLRAFLQQDRGETSTLGQTQQALSAIEVQQ